MALISRLKIFQRNERGAAAVEMAFILPILLTLITGLVEMTMALDAQRKTATAAQSLADLVSQRNELDNSRRDDLFAAGEILMSPWDNTAISIGLASIRFDDDGVATLDWTESHRNGQVDDPMIKAAPLALPGQSVIIVQVNYSHTPLLGDLFFDTINFVKHAYAKPRRTAFVSRIEEPQ